MRFAVAVIVAASTISPDRANGEEKHFALFFAYQDCRGRVENSHTFVEFIRADLQPNVPPTILQRDVISWFPANGKVRIHTFRAEAGRNATLEETLGIVDSRGFHLMSWGPYELKPCAYRLALRRKEELESGRVAYKAIDRFTLANRSANCVHAVADLGPDTRHIGEFNVRFGESATKQVIRHYIHSDYLCNKCVVRDDVFAVLGFAGRCIDRRHDWPATGPIERILNPRMKCP